MKLGGRTLVVTVVAALAAFACGRGRDGFRDDRDPGFVTSDADASTDGCAMTVRCSRDLRSVVDACDESRIVTACAPEQGCAGGTCVPACDAAAANTSSAGCEFAVLPPSRFQSSQGGCFAATITNTWAAPARIDADYAGTPLDLLTSARIVRASGSGQTYEPFTGELQPGDVAVLFLSHSPTRPSEDAAFWKPCPDGITPAVLSDTSADGTERAQSFRIRTSVPVNTYSISPFGGAKSFAPSATLVLPVSAWKTDYIVTSPWGRALSTPSSPTTQIVAAEDETEVTLVPSTLVAGGADVEGAAKGFPQTYRLGRGEVIQFQQSQELSGSRISATKPVAVFSGHQCMLIPAGQPACDTAQLQLFPVHSWGREYAAVPHLSRRADDGPEDYFYRIVAAVDGTVLTYDPARPTDAPTTLDGAGSALFTTRQPFIVKSQDKDHPIAVYAYMSGLEFAGAANQDGDPEFTYVVPTEQYLGHYVFYADPTFRNSHLVVVRSRPEGKELEPVVLDCAGPLEGWKPLGTDGTHELVHVRLKRDSIDQRIGSGTCTAGRHEIDSKGPFTVTVWGTDYAASYAYPGGVALRTLNDVVPTVVR